MKLKTDKKKHDTNAEPGQSVDFSIGDAGVVIEILRNRLYRNPIRTLVQEYISNGRDACRAAGIADNKMVVTAPTRKNPVFAVRDFGDGISPDAMANVFVKYGASTKRSSNKMTGGFGIGAKSAWAYTDSYNIITRVDGVQRNYLAHVGSKNTGTLEFISESETSEENGTEIIVPVKNDDIGAFHAAIQRCLFFFPERPSVLNLEEREWFKKKPSFDENGLLLFTLENDYYVWDSSRHYVVIDSIPYDASPFALRSLGVSECFVALRCGNGELDISASRESLSDCKENQDKVAQMTKGAEKTLQDARIKAGEDAADLNSFISVLSRWKKLTDITSDIKPRFGISVDGNGYVCLEGTPLRGTRYTRAKGNKLSSRENSYITIDSLANFPMLVLLDKEIGKGAISARVKHALTTANKEQAFGLPVWSSIFDVKLSQMTAPRAPRSPNGSGSKPKASGFYNLQVPRGYDLLARNVDFSALGGNADKYLVLLEEKSSKGDWMDWDYIACASGRKVVVVGPRAEGAIKKVREDYPGKFVFVGEIASDIGQLGLSAYSQIVQKVLAQKLHDSDQPALDTFQCFQSLAGIGSAIKNLKDETFRAEFLRLFALKTEVVRLPQAVVEVVSKDASIESDLKAMKLLGTLLYDRMPFILSLERYSFKYADSLVKTLNSLLAQE